MSPPNPSPENIGPHWSKDYVEHLRTIHFSLIALSLAAIVLASAPAPDEIKKAREQLDSIRELVRTWDSYSNWLKAGFSNAAQRIRSGNRWIQVTASRKLSDFPEKIECITELGRNASKTHVTAVIDTEGFIAESLAEAGLEKTRIPSKSSIDLPRPETLAQFRTIWDGLNRDHKIVFPTSLSSRLYFIHSPNLSRPEEKETKLCMSPPAEIPSDLHDRTVKLFLHEKPESHFLPPEFEGKDYVYDGIGAIWREPDDSGPGPKTSSLHVATFYLTVNDSEKFDFDAQGVLLEHFTKNRPVGGDFSHSFAELDKYTRNYQILNLKDFDPILAAEQNRTSESFEAFGVKFPAQATTRWGIVVLLGVQLYFWIHLHELARKLKFGHPGWEVAFIGMYSSLPSRIVYSVSALLLPALAVVALGIRGLYVGDFRWQYWLLLVLGAAVSIVLAISAWWSAPTRSESP